VFADENPFMQRNRNEFSQAVNLLAYIWEVFGSNPDTDILTESFVAFLNLPPFQASAVTVS
jgi:hypothetical protein